MIKKILNASWQFLKNLFGSLFDFLGNLFSKLFQSLFDFLKLLLRPVFILIALIFYIVYKIAELAVTLIQLFLALGKLLLSFIKGIFVTLAGFTYTPTTPNDGAWTPIFRHVVDGLESYQFDTIAYILMFCVWFGTAFAVIKIVSSIRNGGE